MAQQPSHNRLNVQDNYPGSPYSSHSGGSSGRPSMNSFDSQSSRHYVAQEQGSGNYHDRTPPISHGSHGQPMPAHSQTTVVPGYGTRGVKLPPSMQSSVRTAPQESSGFTPSTNGNMVVSVEQIIMKLDMASEENVRLRNALHANNQLLDQKLKQFEPLVAENKKLKEESKTLSDATNRFFEARVAVMGFKCRTMQLQGELDEMKKQKPPPSVNPDEYGRLRQQLDQVLRDNRSLEERNRALSSRAQPGGMDQAIMLLERQVAELNRNVQILQNEKSSHETIIFQLQQDLRSVQDKKQLAEEEKMRAQNDAAQLRDQMQQFERDKRALSRQLEQLHNNAPQDGSLWSQKAQYEQENLGLQARIQELTEHITKLNRQVASEKRMNEQLWGKVHELEEAKKDMRSKLQSYSGSEPRIEPVRPTPVPRTNLQPAMNALQADIERLEAEKKDLQEQLERATRMRNTAEEQFQQSSQKAQSIKQEQYQLQRQLETKDSQLSEQQRAYQSLEHEVERLKREKGQMMASVRGEEDRLRERIEMMHREREELRSKVANLEMVHSQSTSATSMLERQKLEYQGTIARLEEQLRQMQLEPPVAAAPDVSLRSKPPLLAKRLNDALGRIRELETLNKGLEDKQARAQHNFESLREENRSLKNKVEVEHESLRLAAENESAVRKREIDELRAEQSRLCEDKFKLQRELEYVRGDLENKGSQERQLAEQLQSYERQLAEKSASAEQLQRQYEELRAQLDSTQEDKDKKKTKLTALQNQYSNTKKRLEETTSEKDRLQTELHQLVGEKEHISELKKKIEGEKSHLEKTVKEYRTESESILNDYTQAMAELRQVKDEKENLQQMFAKMNHDLTQQKERSRLLEVQRKEVQDKLSHMDEQLKLYHEDFERERHAREAAIKVKNLAEERMKKMERDMKELRDRLNQQTARRMREDQYDDQPGLSEYRRSGEHRFSGSQPSNQLTEPNRFGGGGPDSRRPVSGGNQESPPRTHSGQHQPPPLSQHVHEVPSPAAPPLPPKGTPPSAGVGVFGGGVGGPMGGTVGGAIGGGIGVGHSVVPLRASDPQGPSGSPGHGSGGGGGGGGRPYHHQTAQQYASATPPRPVERVPHSSTMMVTGHPNNFSMNQGVPQERPGGQPLRASENQFPPQGFPGPSSHTGGAFGGGHGRAASGGGGGGGMNILDGPSVPGQASMAGHPDVVGMGGGASRSPLPLRAVDPVGPGGNPPNQLNNLNQPPQGDKYVAPGEVMNEAPPSMACPICGKSDFKTQTDLELHCAQCG